jgi:GT2 family glycosyltransferase
MDQKDVSVVIVCMNNLQMLFPCLDSIINYTHKVKYEIIVVAYFFSEDNLTLFKAKYPKIVIIESNEIRGFSENNNLALHRALGKYCFVLNDDTIMKMPVVDLLVESFKKEPRASFMSPKTLFADGTVQSCGRPPINIWTSFLSVFHIWNEQKIKSKYTYQKGIFQSYNIVGAAFMVKTDVLKKLGYFDEKYFFCPEDIALSTLANNRGYKCFVNEKITLVHLEGGTANNIQTATYPAGYKGMMIFLGNSWLKKVVISTISFFELIFKIIYWILNTSSPNRKINLRKYKNALEILFSSKTTKEIFIKYYKIENEKVYSNYNY